MGFFNRPLTPEINFSISVSMLPSLTARQKEIYDFLLKTIREKGYAPSIPEIGKQFKIASTNGVSDHLKALEKKGYIRRIGKRAIEVLSAVGKPVLSAVREVPILGRVPAGKPFLSEENAEGLLTITSDMGTGKLFALEVKGDSMIDAGDRRGGDPEALLQERQCHHPESRERKICPDHRLGRRIPHRRTGHRADAEVLTYRSEKATTKNA
jgi:hypothetical protein